MKNPQYKKHKTTLKVKTEQKFIGKFKSHDSYGFIDNEFYVRKENIGTAFDKDKVEYLILEGVDDDGNPKYEAKVTKILERYKIHFVGEIIYKEKDIDYVILDTSTKSQKIVSAKSTEYPIGEKVKIKLIKFDFFNLKGIIEKKIGHKNEPDIEIKTILEDYNVSINFSEEVNAETEKLSLNIEEYKKQKIRKDYQSIPLVTIDPNDSKDFDDAIAVKTTENGYLLHVAIADVWTYIRNNPNIIQEAENRGNSIYFMNKVIPMLPEKLSNNFCSLIPHEERCAIVINIQITKEGKILWNSLDINPGIIKSHKRFTYDEVNDFFKTQKISANEEIIESIKSGYELYKILEKNRRARNYVSIEIPEIKMNIGESGDIIGLYKYQRGEAQLMIENFMVLANEAIARLCDINKIPSIYRIHENPDPSKIISFMQEAKKLKFKFPNETIKEVDQKTIEKWLNNNKENVHLEIIYGMLLRSMQKAKYSVTNMGHFGLNLNHYLHFTSPIRRFADTIVHKFIWKYVFEKNKIENEYKIYDELDRIAKNCTEKEIETTEVAKSIENAKIIKYLNGRTNEIYKAKIIGIYKSGAMIKIEDLNLEGFLKNNYPNINLGNYILVKQIYNTKEFRLIKIL